MPYEKSLDNRRLRIGGPHFSRLKLVALGEAKGHKSEQMEDLIKWGYVEFDGFDYTFTQEGKKYWDTLQNMKDLSND